MRLMLLVYCDDDDKIVIIPMIHDSWNTTFIITTIIEWQFIQLGRGSIFNFNSCAFVYHFHIIRFIGGNVVQIA